MTTIHSSSSATRSEGDSQSALGGVRLERRLFIALCGGMMLLVAWLGESLFGIETSVAQIPAVIGAIILTVPMASGALKELRAGRPSSDSLATLAVLAALANHLYLAAGFLAFFLWLSELILSRTAWGSAAGHTRTARIDSRHRTHRRQQRRRARSWSQCGEGRKHSARSAG